MKNFVAGALIIVGCATLMLCATGVVLAMPLQSGRGLGFTVAAMAAAVCSLGLGLLVVRRY